MRHAELHCAVWCRTWVLIPREVVSQDPQGLAADVWGLGCLMYLLLVGAPPFQTEGSFFFAVSILYTPVVVVVGHERKER